jgi:medium-chain acyl-[acyl-carrier-protein] hydrolase
MEQNGVWQEAFKVYAYMTDKHHHLTLFSIANCLQEVAGNHAASHGLGFVGMQERGLYWVLNRLKINILRSVMSGETVTIRTWVSEMKPFSHRHFEVLDADGVVVTMAYAVWIPIDATTHRPKRFETNELLTVKTGSEMTEPEKLRDFEGNWRRCADRPVLFSDLDSIGHVNNAKYVGWIMDDFKKDYEKFECKSLIINYSGEVFLNERVEIFYILKDRTLEYMMKIKKSGRLVARAKLIF